MCDAFCIGIKQHKSVFINVSSFQDEESLIILIYKHFLSTQSMMAKPSNVYKRTTNQTNPDPEGVVRLLNYPV